MISSTGGGSAGEGGVSTRGSEFTKEEVGFTGDSEEGAEGGASTGTENGASIGAEDGKSTGAENGAFAGEEVIEDEGAEDGALSTGEELGGEVLNKLASGFRTRTQELFTEFVAHFKLTFALNDNC